MSGAYSYVATALVAGALAAGGAWKTQEWRWTANTAAAAAGRAEEERNAAELRDSDTQDQRESNDTAAGLHAAALARLNTQLGNARAHIARLSDRQCLSADTVRMLNTIGAPAGGIGLRAPARHVASTTATPAGSAADDVGSGYASERNAAEHIAICRARYAAVSDQINQILDIDERRSALQMHDPLGEVP